MAKQMLKSGMSVAEVI